MSVITHIYKTSIAVSKHPSDGQDAFIGSVSVLFVHSELPLGGFRVPGMLDWAMKLDIHILARPVLKSRGVLMLASLRIGSGLGEYSAAREPK